MIETSDLVPGGGTVPTWAEIREMIAATGRQMERNAAEKARLDREVAASRKKTEKELRELGRKIAGLGEKFGYFTEGLALPSMETILFRQFGVQHIATRLKVQREGRTAEFDVVGFSESPVKRIVIVEIKSRVKSDSIGQLRAQVAAVRALMPEHAGKEVIGILAGVHWDRNMATQAQAAGFHTARIRDEVFALTSAPGYTPVSW